jgi:ABC-type dipeptide/oligopeptide/nickel transport system ATPase subunit
MTQVTAQVENVCKDYAGGQVVYALRHIDLTVAQGKCVAVMGSSGSGNSSPKSFHCSPTNQETKLIHGNT